MLQVISNAILREQLLTAKLNNGLTVYMLPRPGFNKQYAIFATNYGSIDNSFINTATGQEVNVPDGIAHFLEHKLFVGEEQDAFSRFAQLGASANAYTNYVNTAYLFNSSEKFEDSLENLLNFVQSPFFNEENVEKEKGIIAQEINMYDDQPNYQVFYNLLQGLYYHHPVKIDIAGTLASIEKINKELLYLCYNTFYHPGNMLLFLTGDFNPEQLLRTIMDNQQSKDYPKWKGIKRLIPTEPASVYKKVIKEVMDVSIPLFQLGFKETKLPVNPRELVKQEITSEMLFEILVGKGSKLYQTLYEQGLLDDHFHYYYTLGKGYGYLAMGGESRKPEELYPKLLAGLKDGEKCLKEEVVQRQIRQFIGDYIENFNSLSTLSAEFVSYFFRGINYLDILEIIRGIKLSDLKERFKELVREEQAVSSIIASD